MTDGGNPSSAEFKSNNQLASQLTARTPILLRTLFRTVDNSITVQRAPVETFSRVLPTPSQTFRLAKTLPETSVESNGESNREGYSSVQNRARRLNNANTQFNFRSEPEKGYNEAPSPPVPAPPPPPPIVLRETVSVCTVNDHDNVLKIALSNSLRLYSASSSKL